MDSNEMVEFYNSKRYLDIIDNLFFYLPEQGTFDFLYYGKEYLKWTKKDIEIYEKTKSLIYKSAVEEFSYIEPILNTELYQFTSVGKLAKNKGGHFKYQQFLKEQNDIKENNELLTTKKLELDVKNAERLHKTYLWTFAMSIIAIIISIVVLLLKVAELEK